MSLHRLLLWVSKSILHHVLCAGALFHVMWPTWSWPQKLCESKNNAPTFLVQFPAVSSGFNLFVSFSSFRTCKPPLYIPAVPHSALFDPFHPFCRIQTMLTCDIFFHASSDQPSNKADTMVCLKRHQPVPRRMQRASADLSLSDGRSQGASAFCTNFFVFTLILMTFVWENYDFLLS